VTLPRRVFVAHYSHGDYGQGVVGVYTTETEAIAAVMNDVRIQDYPRDFELVRQTFGDDRVFMVADDYWYVTPANLHED